jgi:hypothetical protein
MLGAALGCAEVRVEIEYRRGVLGVLLGVQGARLVRPT